MKANSMSMMEQGGGGGGFVSSGQLCPLSLIRVDNATRRVGKSNTPSQPLRSNRQKSPLVPMYVYRSEKQRISELFPFLFPENTRQ